MSQENVVGKKEENKKNVLLVGGSWDKFGGSFLGNTKYWNYNLSSNVIASLSKMTSGEFDALVIEKDFFKEFIERISNSQEKNVLGILPVGLVLVDSDQKILWFNRQFRDWSRTEDLIGRNFYDPLGHPEMKGPDFCPFRTIRMTGKPSFTKLYQRDSGRFLQMNTAPVFGENGEVVNYLVELHDVTDQSREELISNRLREAGRELADLSKDDILQLSPEERINILRAKIAKYAKEILQFDTIEIRILSSRVPLLLEPLLAIGMAEEAKQRTLYALQEGNGITGWVAFHGKSYRMDDPTEDIFYIEGIPNARSSITVPLIQHGKVIGTFNVESQQPNAFSEHDLHLLESYAVDVAAAIHTLDLLSFEQKDSAYRCIEKVYGDIVGSLNFMLNECARLQRGDAVDPETLAHSIASIQSEIRKIQQVFQIHGEEVVPELQPEKSDVDCRNYPMLRNKRILVIDADPSTGRQLSRILFFYGCTIETATDAGDAMRMLQTAYYDAFISNIKLKDLSAYTLFEQIRDTLAISFVPYVFMTGYGHDGGHVMTKAKVAGVLGYLYKPFKLPQLLHNLKLVISESEKRNDSASTATG